VRSFFIFVGLLAACLIAAAALTYPAWLVVGMISIEPVHRVMLRVAQLLALIGLIALTRRLHLWGREALGYGVPARVFGRQLLAGWLAGIALMTPLAIVLMTLHVREDKPGDTVALVSLIGSAILSGAAIALVEETFFRGLLFAAVARTSGAVAAMVAPSLLYASLHFLGGRLRVSPEEVGWSHGFQVLARLFERYSDPLPLVDSFLALFMLGVLLSLVRMRTGAIAGSMGLHAAGVAAIAVMRQLTVVNPSAPAAYIVGNYDGVIGWAALVWFGVITIGYALLTRRAAGEPLTASR